MKASKRTAIGRKTISKPLRWMTEAGYSSFASTFHQGAGRPENPDRAEICAASASCLEYDPHWGPKVRKSMRKGNKSTAISIYVLNVLPPYYRRMALRDLRLTLAPYGICLIAVRRTLGIPITRLSPCEDGWLTMTGSFQKTFTWKDITNWVGAYFKDISLVKQDADTYLIEALHPRKKEGLCSH